jgi:hypothetical protein
MNINKKPKTFDNLNYAGIIALICFILFLIKYIPTRNQCPRNGALFYFASAIGLIIFLVGKNISRMAKKDIAGKAVAAESILLTVALLMIEFFILFISYFCLTF